MFTASYDLPFQGAGTGAGTGSRRLHAIIENWCASTVIAVQTGYPQMAVNSLNNGGYQLPDRVANGSLAANQRSYRHWFNTSLDPLDPARAFAIPALYQYGNSGFDILRGQDWPVRTQPGAGDSRLANVCAFKCSSMCSIS